MGIGGYKHVAAWSLALLAGALATGQASAQGRPANWQCSNCPFPDGAGLKTTAGAGYLSDDSFKFGDYTGLDDDGAFVVGDFSGEYFGADALRWQSEGRNLGLDSRQLSLEGGWQGLLDLRLGYEELPRQLFETARTIYPTPGSESLVLPTPWLRAPNTGAMADLESSLRGVDVEWDRETWNAGISFIQSPRLRYDVDYRHLERDGKQLWGGSFLTAATTLARPVDDETDTVEAGVTYTAEAWSARVGYFGSFYSNNASTFAWENAFTAPAPGADDGQTALEPDNDFNQVTLSAQYFGWERTRVSARLAAGRMEQDENVLPYTVNPVLAGGALPRSSFDGEVDTLHADLQVSSRPLPKLRLRGEFVYDERDNDTPRDAWDYIVTDTVQATAPRDNLPYGYERYRVAFSGSYRLPFRANGQLGYRYDNFERDFTEVGETEEHEIWAELRFGLVDAMDLRLKYSYADRNADDYDPVRATQPPQNPLMRKYNLADRERQSFEVSVMMQPTDRLDLTFTGLYAEDDYDDSDLGLNEADYRNLTVDAGLRLTNDVVVTGQLGYDRFETSQFGSQSFSRADWSADQEDESWIAGVSVDLPRIVERISARIGYTYISTKGEIDNDTSGLRSFFPDLDTDRERVEAELRYDFNRNLDFGLAYLYENFDVDDWTLDGVGPATVSNLLASGARWPGYDVNLVTLSFTWSLAP
jgi:MtrB/PioB family decaheme-associated outer membrane protein